MSAISKIQSIGIVSIFAHYPVLSPTRLRLDCQLRIYLEALGHAPVLPRLYDVESGCLPLRAVDCDCWIVSGAFCDAGTGPDFRRPLLDFLRSARRAGRAVYGLNHAEHALHAAFCPAAEPPASLRYPRAIRNPFWSFQQRDRLFAFDPRLGRVMPLPRPACIGTGTRSLLARRSA